MDLENIKATIQQTILNCNQMVKNERKQLLEIIRKRVDFAC